MSIKHSKTWFWTQSYLMVFKMIHIHFILYFKHDGHQKAYSVADGHLTEIPTDSVYFGVVS